MITRIWHGRTDLKDADRYLDFLLGKGTQGYRETEGIVSVKMLKQKDKDCCHFYTVTEWRDYDAIKKFANDDYEKAVYYPEDEDILLEFEEKVEHYETYSAHNASIQRHIFKFKQLWNGDGWLGESFAGKLKVVNEFTAFVCPAFNLHSIAEVLWHCLYWKKVAIGHLQGDHTYKEKTMEKMNFLHLDELKCRGWQWLLSEWEQTNESLIQNLNDKQDDILKTDYVPGYSFEYLIEGIIQHEAYHLGQIGLVWKMVNLKESLGQIRYYNFR